MTIAALQLALADAELEAAEPNEQREAYHKFMYARAHLASVLAEGK